MECIIPGANFKAIAKAIQALSRLGDEVCFCAKPDRLSLVTINMSRTAVVTCDFLDVFFASYSVEEALLKIEGCICKLNMKTIAGIFRPNKEKRVGIKSKIKFLGCENGFKFKLELCKIEYVAESTSVTIKMKYKQDVTMTHVVKLIDCKHTNLTMPDDQTNQLNAPSSFYNQILVMFQHNDEDISWDVVKNKAIVRNYNADMQNALKTIRTQVTLNSAEFATYKVLEDTEITFSLRPFRAAINFAEAFHLNVTIKFSTPGKPTVLLVKNTTFEVKFLLATLNSEGDSQSVSCSTNSVEVGSNKNLGEVEKVAVDTMDWEDEEDFAGVEVVEKSPDSPRTKKLKVVFARCFEPTLSESALDLGAVLAENSDIDSD